MVGSPKLSPASRSGKKNNTFGLGVVLFFGLAVGEALGIHFIKAYIGYEGILGGLCAAYTGLAQVLDRVILPLGPYANKD
jgi:succinate-acetate transporter protein